MFKERHNSFLFGGNAPYVEEEGTRQAALVSRAFTG